MNILFTAAEAHPYMKTGGLGDVAYALPKALRKLGHDARVIIPKYGNIPQNLKNNMKFICNFSVFVSWRTRYCGLFYSEFDGVPFYFIDNEYYFNREGAYGYYDDGERFAFFCKAVLEAIHYMVDFIPNVIHCNDWHTGMIPPLLKDIFRFSPNHQNIKTVFTIHNLKYQGVFAESILSELLGLDEGYNNENALKYYDGISFMKGGLIFADKISTVSRKYAEEIKTEYYGEGLHGLLKGREHDLWGIVNGLDYDTYNPETDWNIPFHYNYKDSHEKLKNKTELQKRLGLYVSEDTPIIGMVSRLVEQKGLDLITCVFEELLTQNNVQFVVEGTGDPKYEEYFKYLAWKYPGKVSSNIFFGNSLASLIYAGSDMFLMPSKFEPCGIGQLIALRYGTIPIVRETGGLFDTVKSYDEITGEGNGFSFTGFNAHDMLYTIRRALNFYNDKDIWWKLVKNGMQEDNSWNKSANIYVDLYKSLL